TPAYLSPEQAGGEAAGPAADLYSLGAVAFFLLTGRPPFAGSNGLALLHAHRTQPAPPLGAEVPPDLAAVVLRLLAKRPADRPASAAEVDRELAACACAAQWTDADAAGWWASQPAAS